MSWTVYQEKYRNSVLQIIVGCVSYNPFRPYRSPRDFDAKGSGFFFAAEQGLLLTNAHVVEDSNVITGRIPKLGKRDLRMRLVSLCREKDVAVCQIFKEDMEMIAQALFPSGSSGQGRSLSSLDMKLGDSLILKEVNKVMAIGFPLGEDAIKFTTGTISGFFPNIPKEDNKNTLEDSEDSPSYLQLSNPINEGNSGGPLINEKGEVIGITSAGRAEYQNVAYAIASRTILAILGGLISPLLSSGISLPSDGKDSVLIPQGGDGKFPYILPMPRTSFDWCETNNALLYTHLHISRKNITGIYVTKVNPDSCLIGLEEGDVITSLKMSARCSLSEKVCSSIPESLEGQIDNYGYVSIKSIDRKLSLKEFLDLLPLGNTLQVILWRGGTEYQLDVPFVSPPSSSFRRKLRYLHYEPLDYEIIGGLCLTPLTLDHVERDRGLRKYAQGKKLFEPYLVIAQVLPGTEAQRVKSLDQGDVVDKVNGEEVRNLATLREVLRRTGSYFLISSQKGQVLAVDVEQMKKEDAEVIKVLGISSKKTE